MNNKILFLSALDFKEKSIQVIRKTPEAYARAGWEVHYVVSRDMSKYGNYFYESEINPDNIKIYRIEKPLTFIIDKIANHKFRTIVSKLSSYLNIIKLAIRGKKILKNNSFDVLYGYEVHGVLAIAILRLFKKVKNRKIVHRFQGTWYYEYLKNKKILKLMLNWESCIALRLRSDLCIMTDDGTSGEKAMRLLRSKSHANMRFWTNGVDEINISREDTKLFKESLKRNEDDIIAVSTCRLESWKRLDRSIRIINQVVNHYGFKKIRYYIIGDGSEKEFLNSLVKKNKLFNNVFFTGGVTNSEVYKYLYAADIFLSMNDLSNVGNPLLEAIRANKIIFTLNNGDTGSWIQHRQNGFIYDINRDFIDNIARDICGVISNDELRNKIQQNIIITGNEKLWSWEERLNAELEEVEVLLSK